MLSRPDPGDAGRGLQRTQMADDQSLSRRIGQIERLLEGCDALCQVRGRLNQPRPAGNLRDTGTLAREEAALLAVVNKWWRADKPERFEAQRLAAEIGISAFWYALQGIESSLQSVDWTGPYHFVRSDRDGGWLWVQAEESNEGYAVPTDSSYFQTAGTKALVSRMFDGEPLLCGTSRTALRACLFRRTPQEPDYFRVIRKGTLSTSASGTARPKSQDSSRFAERSEFDGSARQEAFSGLTLAQWLKSEFALMHTQSAALDSRIRQLQKDQETLRSDLTSLRNVLQTATKPTARPQSQPQPNKEPPLAVAILAQRLDVIQQEIRTMGRQLPSGGSPPQQDTATSAASNCGRLDGALDRLITICSSSSDTVTNVRGDPMGHLLRLDRLHRSFAAALVDWGCGGAAELTHLSVEGEGFSLHRVDLNRSRAGVEVYCVDCRTQLADQLLFQLFLTVRDGDDAWVFLAPGDFSTSRFPRGYRLLLQESPNGAAISADLDKPAHLKRVGGSQLSYEVAGKMVLRQGSARQTPGAVSDPPA